MILTKCFDLLCPPLFLLPPSPSVGLNATSSSLIVYFLHNRYVDHPKHTTPLILKLVKRIMFLFLNMQCRKKHTYVCPVFEATGNCPQGSKCKLHHPKNKRKGVKRKASSEMKNGRGRYFGSPHIDSSEHITAGSEKASAWGNNDIFFKKGKFVDFISLDGSDEEELTSDQRSEEPPLCESSSAEMQLDDLDELIKPMKLINRNRSVDSSPFMDSPSDMAASYVSEES